MAKHQKTKTMKQIRFLLGSTTPLTKAEKATLERELEDGTVKVVKE